MQRIKKGFSLIELLIVLAVIAAVASVMTTVAINAVRAARATKVAYNFRILSQSVTNKIYIDNEIPSTINELGENIDTENYGVAWRESDGYYEFVVFTSEDVDITTLHEKLLNVSGTAPSGDFTFIAGGKSDFDGMTACYIFLLDEQGNPASMSYGSYTFDEDFDISTLVSVYGRDWVATEQGLMPSKWGEARAILPGDETWTDYIVNVVATYSEGNGYAIYIRATGEADNITAYAFQVDPGYGSGAFLVRPVYDGRERSPIAITWFRNIDDGWTLPVRPEKHYITITAKGNHFTMTFNGIEVLNFTDDRFPSGRVGIRKWHKTDVAFESIEIQQN
ncbi:MULTISPECIES: family 16 glycoside hydrolase [unclassified Kosmotoga]|uniref:family 16 glycoside hydrolase n=1 Tax=unclassified Kosmotoga TaxID=2631489 RepID=UPI0007C4CB2C|nr:MULTISPECIES: family 16 glycoside hydrolase [unclassified Kosmotoga]MDI3524371.1 hypothetical protein [Kosmotoga sp.]